MAEGGEKRDPVSHRTKSQMRRHGRSVERGGEQTKQDRKNRAKRNNARGRMIKRGRARKGDGKDVNHKKPLRSGGSNSDSNLEVQSKSKNRGWRNKRKKA